MQSSHIKDILNLPDALLCFAQDIHSQHGQCIIVGGTIRDILLGAVPKDLDIEIHGMSPQALERTLRKHARFKVVGRSFTVWKCRFEGIKDEIDISIPCNTHGEAIPNIGFEQAALRRDFRMNAMGYHIHNQSILDPLNGQRDIQDRIIRMTGHAQLLHDPLRFFRAVQFAARFEMKIEDAIVDLVSAADFSNLSHERVRGELEKLFLKSRDTSIGLKYAIQLGLFSAYLPELNADAWKDTAKAFNDLNSLVNGEREAHILLYWAMLMQHTAQAAIVSTLTRLGIVGSKADKIGVICQNWQKICSPCSDVQLQFIAEHNTIAQLCLFATACQPRSIEIITANQDLARRLNILNAPLPPIIEGGTLFRLGYRGVQIRDILMFIRNEQLHNRIKESKEALSLIQTTYPLNG